jgi:hypothetical protein
MTMSVDDTTGRGAGLIEFLEYVDEKGLMNPSTAKAYRAAAREVLSAVEGDEWPSFDLREADVEDLVHRFQVKAGMRYTPRSLTTYKSRFRSAVSMYLAYMEDPGGWRPPRPQPSRVAPPRIAEARIAEARIAPSVLSPRRPRRQDTRAAVPTDATVNVDSFASAHGGSDDMVSYPFPLRREGGVVLVTLTLPTDLTAKEAERISAHLKTIAIPEQLALPRPSGSDNVK